jgi:hypothetical protein
MSIVALPDYTRIYHNETYPRISPAEVLLWTCHFSDADTLAAGKKGRETGTRKRLSIEPLERSFAF